MRVRTDILLVLRRFLLVGVEPCQSTTELHELEGSGSQGAML
jgi:hypothetical protein